VGKISKNNITPDQLNMVCRHVKEQMDNGITENFAIRPLILMADIYAKLKIIGNASPDSAKQFPIWSKAAVELWREKREEEPKRPPYGKHLRNEHGYGRTAFAKKVLDRYEELNELDKTTIDKLVDDYWRVAVITLDEDKKLNRSNTDGLSAEKRWEKAGIEFYPGKSPYFGEK